MLASGRFPEQLIGPLPLTGGMEADGLMRDGFGGEDGFTKNRCLPAMTYSLLFIRQHESRSSVAVVTNE